MEVDLHKLPVPDWDLHCPNCRYLLRGLPTHRCAECGAEFDIAGVIRTWTRLRSPTFSGDELPMPDFGLHCAACGCPLAGARQQSCPACKAPFDLRQLRPEREWFLVDSNLCGSLPLPGVEALLAAENVPYFPSKDKLTREILLGPRIVGTRLLAPSEFFFDVLALVRRAELDMQAARTARAGDEWTCPACHRGVPAHFEICWNCQMPRQASTVTS